MFREVADSRLEWRYIHFSCFARNGCWGTCADCPRGPHFYGAGSVDIYPEFCPNRERGDHKRSLTTLVEQYNNRIL